MEKTGVRHGGRAAGVPNATLKTKRLTFKAPFREGRSWYTRTQEHGSGAVARVRLPDATSKTTARAAVRALWKQQMELEDAAGVTATEPSERTISDALIAYGEAVILPAMRPRHILNLELLYGKLERDGDAIEARPGLYARTFQALKVTHVSDVSLGHIERLFAKVWAAKKGRTAYGHYAKLRKFFAWAVAHGFTRNDPFKEYTTAPMSMWRSDMAASKDRGEVLSLEEARALLRAASEPYTLTVTRPDFRPAEWTEACTPPPYLRTLVLIGLRSGLRAGNILGLRWGHVMPLDAGLITLPGTGMKSKRKFCAPLHSEVLAHLRGLLAQATETLGHAPLADDLVLPGVAKAEGFCVRRAWKTVLVRAGLGEKAERFRIHDMRHSFSSWLAVRVPEAVKYALMGHTPSTISARYTHLEKDAGLLAEVREHLEKLEWLEPKPRRHAEKALQ